MSHNDFEKRLWFFTGLPCSGKSSAAKLMGTVLPNSTYISTGNLARDLSKTDKKLWDKTEKNDLFPLEDLLRAELKSRIEDTIMPNVIVDGFPRFDAQAEYLAKTFWGYRPVVIDVNAGDVSTLWLRAQQRARDKRDTDQVEFNNRLAAASKNLSGALSVIHYRLGQYHTLMSADQQYMVNTLKKIVKANK